MIRLAWPEDTDAIARLAIAQYQRTPWPLEMEFPPVHEFVVSHRYGRVGAVLGYRRDKTTIRVMHVWADDGFRGRRAAVEVMKFMERWADKALLDLMFTARSTNSGLANAVKWHGCLASDGEEPGTVLYRRKAAVTSSAAM